MSSSQHPIALRLEGYVGGDARLLATVMGLPLVDGIFPALVLAGALNSPANIVQVGLLIFGGSATVAVILAEMDRPPREAAATVLLVGAGLVSIAALEAALAPTIASLLNLPLFERFAALVIGAIAAKTASARIGEHLPSPGTIVGLGLIASLDPAGATFAVDLDPLLMARAAAAAGTGVAFALGVALLGPRLRGVVDIDRFRFGSAVALGLLPFSILQIPGIPVGGRAPLAVVVVAGLLAYAPDQAADSAPDPGPGAAAEDRHRDVGSPVASDPTRSASGAGAGDPARDPAVTDGGDGDRPASGAANLPEGEEYGPAPAAPADDGETTVEDDVDPRVGTERGETIEGDDAETAVEDEEAGVETAVEDEHPDDDVADDPSADADRSDGEVEDGKSSRSRVTLDEERAPWL